MYREGKVGSVVLRLPDLQTKKAERGWEGDRKYIQCIVANPCDMIREVDVLDCFSPLDVR